MSFFQTIAITDFETETSNFFAIDFSNTLYAKKPIKNSANMLIIVCLHYLFLLSTVIEPLYKTKKKYMKSIK